MQTCGPRTHPTVLRYLECCTLLSLCALPCKKLKPSTSKDMHLLQETLNSVPWGVEHTPPGFWMSDLGVINSHSLRHQVHSTWVLSEWPRDHCYIILIFFALLLILDGAWKGRRIRGDVLSQLTWRVYATWWHAELHCAGVVGCSHRSRVCSDRTTGPHRWIHHSIGSDYGGSTWKPWPPAYSWNGGLVQHALKGNPALRDLEHVQVDSPGLTYLFFYDWHGYRSLSKEEAVTMHSHIADAFAKWIGRSAHFNVVPLLLEAGWQCTTAPQERCRQLVWPLEEPILSVHASKLMDLGSSQLVGGVPPVLEAQEGAAEPEMPRVNAARPRRWQTKAKLAPWGGEGGSPPSSPECPGGADSDDYSMTSKSGEGCRHRRHWQAERRLAPARLNLPIFRYTDANADVTYEIWHFDVQGWLDQYDEMSMHPHIFGSLQGYPGKWARSLPGGMNISLKDLLRHMDHTFRNVCNYDSMIWSLYEIHQKENETVEKYMLRVHEAVPVVKCT